MIDAFKVWQSYPNPTNLSAVVGRISLWILVYSAVISTDAPNERQVPVEFLKAKRRCTVRKMK